MMLAFNETFSDSSDSESSSVDPWAIYFRERGPRMRGRLPSRQPTGLYVHSSPPTGVPVHDSVVRQWLRGGEMARLKELVLEGEGAGLVGEYSPDITARAFLRALPRILSRIEEAHAGAGEGDVERTERAIRRERAVRVELSKDQAGLSLLHKAVIRGHSRLQDWLLANFPELVHLTDRERRTALHYAGSSGQPEETWRRLTEAGADPGLVDLGGFTPAYYMHHPRRARPPQPRSTRPRPDRGLVVKPANIRIWIHDRDLGRLQKVVWEGFGQKLLSETSSQPKVRRFLSAVPYILGSIRDVHKSAIENDVETLQKRTADPVPKDILLSKDANGLNPLHKAAGLGQKEAVEEILKRAPEAANAPDALGRTPLHYAAALRDSQLYQTLVEAGAVDHLQDKKGNTPSYYRSKPGELESGKLLTLVPEAPRTAHIFPPSWDWRLLQSGTPGVRQESSEGIPKETTASTTEEISKDENMEEARPEVSEDEGVGSENAQSVEDTASPQNSENIDMEQEDDSNEKLDRTITISRSELFGEDSGAIDVDTEELADSSQQENSEAENKRENQIPQNHAEVELDITTAETAVTQEDRDKAQDTVNEEEKQNAIREESPSSQIEEPIEKKDNDVLPAKTEESDQTNNIGEIYEQKEEHDVTPGESNAVNPNEPETNINQENSGEVGEVEATHPPLVRSGTIILQGESASNLIENVAKSTSQEGNIDEDEQDAAVEDQKYSQELSGSNEEILENKDGSEESTGELQTGDENVEPQSDERKSGRKSSKKSARKTSVESGRQSLKSRAMKAIELGRGQVDLIDTSLNSKNDSDTTPNDVSGANAENETNEDQKGGAEGNGEDENNQEQNVDSINIEKESEVQKLNNSSEPNEGENRDINNVNKTEVDHISKESTEEYYLDSLEADPRADINEITAEEEPGEGKEGVQASRQLSARSERAPSAAQRDRDRRSEAERLVAAGDMEGMAEMVLAGEGEALLDLTSDNPDVQLFINNVPQYMAKIERVHKASREGDLRGVQTSLDRRKFAVARDNGTSLKPTPLHVAVLFGRTSVLRYLAGRFPETMHAQDSAGRTPLHYATTLPDNGHFYSLLITLGADKAVSDSAGRTAEFYLRNKDELTREMLLAEYQDRPIPIDMSGLNFNRYSDKVEDDTVSARHDVDEEALLDQMERCYRLVLHRAPASTLGQILHRDLFEELRLRYTRLDNTLLDILRPVGKDLGLGKNRILTDPNFSGVTLPDAESFKVFENLVEPLVKELSGVRTLENPSESDFTGDESEAYFNIDVDPGGGIIKSCVVEIARNLSIVPFAKNLKLSELEKVEVALSSVLTAYYKRNKEAAFIDEAGENHGSYYSLGEASENKELFQDLKEEGLLVEGVEEGNWPYGRGVFISPYGDITAWVNVKEHIHLLAATPADKRGHIGPAYKSATEIVSLLEEKVECERDGKFGLLATDPGLVGNCLRLHVVASLTHVGEDLADLRRLALSKGLLVEANPAPAAQQRYGILTEKKLTGAEILREGYPIFKPEEGQYLASTLGEPLIKGLTEVAHLKPPNPIIHLANFLLAFKKPEDAEINHKTVRSIEGTPAGHESISNENDKIDQNEDEEEPNNEETEEEGRNEELGEEEEGMNNAEEDSNSIEQNEAFKPVNRDEHGQSMLHFAAARSHGRNAMYQLLQEMDTNPGLRDSLYRTARDIAEQTEIVDNVRGIDRYVVSLAARGEENKLKELLIEGYDHILDAEDGGNILDIVEERGQESILQFLKGITQFEETRDKLHRAIRFGSLAQVQEIFNKSGAKHRLAQAKNIQGRCSLHVAVLSQDESTVEYIANKYPETLHIGDNLMRTPLHYAMALDKVESLSRILINAGAQRVLKDLKGRQPSYYFMNKTDIQKLQDEEEAMRY